jgi:hypothetical protein
VISTLLASLLFACLALAQGKAGDAKALPYLGPGADKLSPEQYEKIYRNYIQASALLGYPFLKGQAAPCDHALNAVFRQAGLFAYPVPNEAQQITRATKVVGEEKMEAYESAGTLIQVVRDRKSGGLKRVIWINSASPKATRRLGQIAKKEILTLKKDPVTGLERVKGIPVGLPHPFLAAEGQGLYVRILTFNGKVDACEPVDFVDNTWVAGFDLSENRCAELQFDAERVWKGQLSAQDFSDRELQRMKGNALKSALAKGEKEESARKIIEKHFVAPLTSEINVVGSAMRNLAQCNLLAIGRAGDKARGGKGQGTGRGGEASGSGAKGGTKSGR